MMKRKRVAELCIIILVLFGSCTKTIVEYRYIEKDVQGDYSTEALENFINSGLWPTMEPKDLTITGNKIIRYRTERDKLYDRYLEPLDVSTAPSVNDAIEIDPDREYQTMLGVGGSFTDTTVYNLERMSEKNQRIFWNQYFGDKGSQYTMTRITIGSADFSTKFYDYCHDPSLEDDKNGKASRNNKKPDPGIFINPEDPAEGYKGIDTVDLKWFKLHERDTEHIIPAIKKANTFVAKYADKDSDFPNEKKQLTILAAPWSPPAWFKHGGQRPGGTALGGLWQALLGELEKHSVKEEYYPAYAKYFSKYLHAMKDSGIDIYSISLNNEAQNHPAWEMCLWSQDAAKKFIGKNLGPMLVNDGFKPTAGKGGVRLAVWDWDRPDFGHADGFKKWTNGVLGDAEAKKYIDGIAFHWYGGLGNAGASWGREFNLLSDAKKNHKVQLWASEACQENGPVLREWFPASRYIYDMINCFENGAECWIDWNLLLDENGGPTHEVSNKCHAPVHVDTKGNDDPADDVLIFNPCYYILKRMSREVRPGSKRIETESSLYTGFNGDIYHTAFKQSDGSISLLVGNIPNGDYTDAGKTYTITVKIKGKEQSFTDTIPPHSFTVYKFDPSKYKEPEPVLQAGDLVSVPKGSYWSDNLIPRKIEINDDFQMLKSEVSQKLYMDVMKTENPVNDIEQQGDEKPLTNISYKEMVAFCNALSRCEKKTPYYKITGETIGTDKTANGFRLPKEEEFRWAAMGATSGHQYSGLTYSKADGIMQPFAGYDGDPNKIGDYVCYKENSDGKLQAVTAKEPNALGLYGMSGNAAELSDTYYFGYVLLGGSVNSEAKDVAINAWSRFTAPDLFVGFRVVCRP